MPIVNHFQNVSDMTTLLNTPNQVTGGFAWIGLMVMMEIIIVLALLPFGFNSAILAAAFIMLISGIFFTYLGVISWTWLMLFLGQILFIILYITWQERQK